MKVYTNTTRIKQKQQVGLVGTLSGAIIMVVGLALTLQPQYGQLAWLLSLVGLAVAMVGSYHVNRWVRPPLAHQLLARELQRLDARHLLFNYVGVVPHLLLTPKGLITIQAKRYDGPVSYEARTTRWRGKFSLARLYGQGMTAESLGDPGEEVTKARNEVLAWLRHHLPDIAEDIPVEGLALFLSPKVALNVAEPPVPIAQPDSLRKSVQGLLAGEEPLAHATYKRLREQLESEAVAIPPETPASEEPQGKAPRRGQARGRTRK